MTTRHPPRLLNFTTLDDILAEAGRIAAAEQRGTLRRLGNWTAGQAFGHLAAWMSYPYEGYPMPSAPWFVRLLGKLMLRRILRNRFSPGYRIPKAPGGTWATDVLTLDEGLGRLRQAVERLQRESPPLPSPVFGRMTHQQAIALNLRHAELHLGFLDPSPTEQPAAAQAS